MPEQLRVLLLSSGLLPWAAGILMLLMILIGQRIGARLRAKSESGTFKADETIVGAIFGLLALIMAFTFSGASDRFDHRRELIAKEVSTIGTAYASIDLLASRDQENLRNHFRTLVDQRIHLYRDVTEVNVYENRIKQFDQTRSRLWTNAVKSVKDTPFPEKLVAAQILPEISDMNDALDNQRLAMRMHPPKIIMQSLLALILIGAFVTGYNLGLTNKSDWLLVPLFIILMAGTYFVTINLEYPLVGFINLNDFQIEMIHLRESM